MSRAYVIEKCGSQCPKWDHNGAFGIIACVPVCGMFKNEDENVKSYFRVIPHEVYTPDHTSHKAAKQVEDFPSWCPLKVN